jgi:hypothetical protein
LTEDKALGIAKKEKSTSASADTKNDWFSESKIDVLLDTNYKIRRLSCHGQSRY